jgi:hypothetical protein
MEQVFEHYEKWEDFKNGMYNIPKSEDEEKYCLLAMELLSNKEMFLGACKNVLSKWKISSKVNLTNTGCNRRAWLGQASCNLIHNVPETCTRMAWARLTDQQQFDANTIAEMVINSFEVNYERQDSEICF